MASATTTITTVMFRRRNQCNSCNIDLPASFITTGNRLLCPHYNSHLPSNNNPNPNSSQLSLPSFTPTTTTITASEENFRLDSPYFHRLINHLLHSNDSSLSTTTTDTTTVSHRHSPTSKSAVEAIPTVTITSAFLLIDPIIVCAVCKDQFVIEDETKQLPCKHIYHPDCILPWLSQHTLCPVCGFQLPKEPVSSGVKS